MVDAGNFPGKVSVAEFALEWFFTSVLSIMTGYNCQTFVRISTSFLRTFKMTVLVSFKLIIYSVTSIGRGGGVVSELRQSEFEFLVSMTSSPSMRSSF